MLKEHAALREAPKDEGTERTTQFEEAPPVEFQTGLLAAARRIEQNGLKYHGDIHDDGGLDVKEYHNLEHPMALEFRAREIAKILGLSSKQHAIVKMAIAFHDTVIEYSPADPPTKLTAMIRRHRGAKEGDNKPYEAEGNEGRSAQLLEAEMRNANELVKPNPPLFSEEQIKTAVEAIHATYVEANFGADFQGAKFEEYPDFDTLTARNPELAAAITDLKSKDIIKGPLFSQPHLEHALQEATTENGKPVPREVVITALADLGAAGLVSKENFFKEGDAEMREVYGNLRNPEIMQKLLTDPNAAEDRKLVMEEVFLKWLDSQSGFVVFQALRFEKIMLLLEHGKPPLNDLEKQGLRNQFSYFTENIRATTERAKSLKAKAAGLDEQEGFQLVALSMGYKLKPEKTPNVTIS